MRDARRTSCLVIQLGRSEALQNEQTAQLECLDHLREQATAHRRVGKLDEDCNNAIVVLRPAPILTIADVVADGDIGRARQEFGLAHADLRDVPRCASQTLLRPSPSATQSNRLPLAQRAACSRR